MSDKADAWVRSEIDDAPAPVRPQPAWRVEADTLIPRRLFIGPIDVGAVLQADARHLRPAYWELSDKASGSFYEHGTLLQYWADGKRTVTEIADLAEIETGQAADELVLRYFKLLAEAGMIELKVEG
jgi:hypothetical protein